MRLIDPIQLSRELRKTAKRPKPTEVVNAKGSTLCPVCSEPLTPMEVSTIFDGDGTGHLPVLACLKDAVVVPDYSPSP